VIFESPRFALKGGIALNLRVGRARLDVDAVRASQGFASDPLEAAQPGKLHTTNKPPFEFQAAELVDRFDRFPR